MWLELLARLTKLEILLGFLSDGAGRLATDTL